MRQRVYHLRWVIPNWRIRRQFKPGGFYLDHGSHPCVLICMPDSETLEGVSLVDGRVIGGCSIFHCGPEPVSREKAMEIAAEMRKTQK
jgi:hypothetical protein